jgi:hypothetical protein
MAIKNYDAAGSWANQASKKVLLGGAKGGWRLAKWGMTNPWATIVIGALSFLSDEQINWVKNMVEKGFDVTFDTFEEFYEWLFESDNDVKIIADYINQAVGAPDGVLRNVPPELIEKVDPIDTRALARVFNERVEKKGKAVNYVETYGSEQQVPKRSGPTATMGLSEQHRIENGRTSVVKRMQSLFNAHGVHGTRQLQSDLKAFIAMTDDELDGAISALLTVR